MKDMSLRKASAKHAKKSSRGKKTAKTPVAATPVEMVEFILKHFQMKSWEDYKGIDYSAEEILSLLEHVSIQFAQGRSLCKMSPPVTVVGDLNGNYHDLIRILNIREGIEKEDEKKQVFATQKFVFLGDYTESSRFNLETICLLFALKICYNDRYILLRGHQEVNMPHEKTDFQEQIISRFPDHHQEIWKKFSTAFNLMPVAAIVGEKILCVHGGISPEIKKSISEIKKVHRSDKSDALSPLVRDLLFASPVDDDGIGADSDEPVYFMSVKRDFTKLFNEAAVKDFCEKTKVQLIVRSHEVPVNGFRFFAEKRMITIFSTAMYSDYRNKAAILKISRTGIVSIVQLRVTDKKKHAETEKTDKPEEREKEKEERTGGAAAAKTEEKSNAPNENDKTVERSEEKEGTIGTTPVMPEKKKKGGKKDRREKKDSPSQRKKKSKSKSQTPSKELE